MRSDLLLTNPLVMCMNKSHLESQKSTPNISIIKSEEFLPEITTYPISLPDSSSTYYDDNDIIEFGPIKVKPRKKPAPTLATGRRSKYEILTPDEAQKRDVRRARNRAAAERVRINRLNVEQELQEQIDILENQEQKLLYDVQMLQHQKLHLETRVRTHEKICPTMPLLNPQNDFLSSFISNTTPTSTTIQQISDLTIDELLSESPSSVQNQTNNYSNSITNMMPGDYFDDIFMDS